MSYLTNKIKNEFAMSRQCVNTLALRILEVTPLKEKIISKILKVSDKDIIEFLNKYEDLIERTCNSRKYYLKDEAQDCKQFIRMHLCRIYHRKHKYTNFDRVVKSVIKRKAIDFTKFRNNDLRNIITESDLFANTDDDNDCSIEDVIAPKDFEFFGDVDRIGVIFAKIKDVIDNFDCFTEHDRHVAKIIQECIEKKDYMVFNIDYIISKISEDKTEASVRFRNFTKRVSIYIAREDYL